MKTPVYQDETCKLEGEFEGDVMYLHLEVFRWTPSSLKHMRKVFDMLKDFSREAGYSKLATITPNPKFVKLFGGECVHKETYNGTECEVIRWVLK